ncbi:MAG: right-handed parallel beta-helix repeat-containing protein [bacterium]|nr:right-handed parallel beta-helix repeat-containing protein [bacterium]
MAEGVASTHLIAEDPPVELVEKRDDHTRVWEIAREVETTHPDGSTTVDTVKSYIHEKASGLCYRDGSGNLVPSVPEWRQTPEGFVIDRCGYRLSVGRTLASSVTYSIDGHRLFLRPSCLIASDGSRSDTLAVLNPEIQGFVSADSPSTLRFADALGKGLHLEFVAEKDGFHQNVILTEPIPLDQQLDAEQTRIYMYTEIDLREYAADPSYSLSVAGTTVDLSSAQLATEPSVGDNIVFRRTRTTADGGEKEDPIWWFGVSPILDASGQPRTEAERRLCTPQPGGETYLVESIPQSFLQDAEFPVVLDFQTKSGAITQDEMWDPRYTYWVSGDLNVSATLKLLPGTTVKVNPSKSIYIQAEIVAEGEPYNYITFTKAKNDDCGDQIPGALDGNAWYLIYLQSGSLSSSVVRYCKLSYAFTAIRTWQDLTDPSGEPPFANNIIRNANWGIDMVWCSVPCRNNLVHSCSYGISVCVWYQEDIQIRNNTIHACGRGVNLSATYQPTGDIAENLFTNCAYDIYSSGGPYPDIHHNRWYPEDQFTFWNLPEDPEEHYNEYLVYSPYDTSPLGDFFLNTAGPEFVSKLKDKGSRTALDAGFGTNAFTVEAPEEVPAGNHYAAETWGKVDSEEPTSNVDIGYHHCRVDRYIPASAVPPNGCTFTGQGANLTLDPGVVVGINTARSGSTYTPAYLKISAGAKLDSLGHPITVGYNVFLNARSMSMKPESPKFEFGVSPSANPYVQLLSSANADSRVQFTRTIWLGSGLNVQRQLNQPIGGNVFSLSTYGAQVSGGNVLFNSLAFHNCHGVKATGSVQVLHSTFDMNETGVEATPGSGQEIHIRDSIFTKHDNEGILISGGGDVYNYYNAFWDNDEDVSGGSPGNGSQVLSQSPYPDWQERYRLQQLTTLTDAGSVMAADAGLAAYTTASDNRYDTRHVDWGFHFLARPTIWVDDDYEGEYGASDGSRLRPYTAIHGEGNALENAGPGTTILVLPGKYDYLAENEQIVAESHVDIIGSGHGATILDAHDVETTDSYPLIKLDGKTDITIAGIAITRRWNEDYSAYTGQGAGMICRNSTDILVRDCLFTDNDADFGGAMFLDNSSVTVEDCIIHQNRAISGKAGGGLYIKSCSRTAGHLVTLRRCIISNNTAGVQGEDDLTMGGGGIYCTLASDPKIVDCVISHNRASAYRGGGIYLDQNCSATIWNCVVEHNMSTRDNWEDPDKGDGGGIYVKQCSPGIWGCTISDNTSITGGTGIRCVGPSCSPLIANCTVVYNSGPQGTSAIYCDGGASPTVLNCIAWGNGDDLYGCSATNSWIQENGASDPHLVGSAYGPYHIADTSEVSPCVGAGTTTGLPSDFKKGKDVDGDYRIIGAIDIGSDERHPFRQMIGIKRVFAQNKVTITWRTDPNTPYGVYSSTDPFTNYMSWGERATVQGNGGVVSWDDTEVSFASGTQAYYKILAKSGAYAGQFSRPVGLVNADVEDISSSGFESAFMAIPLELKYQAINGVFGHVDEGLGSMIAGDPNGQHLAENDRIEFLMLGHPDWPSTWTRLQLKWISNEPKWYTTPDPPLVPVESYERFSLGEAFRIVAATGSRSTITFLGFVPSRPVGLMVFRHPTWGLKVEFGYPYPVDTTLNGIPFIQYGAVLEDQELETVADEIWIPTQPQVWKELRLETDGQGNEQWMDGGSPAGPPDIDVLPGKGFRYYGDSDVLGRDGGPIADRIYYYRVPVVRPYRCG